LHATDGYRSDEKQTGGEAAQVGGVGGQVVKAVDESGAMKWYKIFFTASLATFTNVGFIHWSEMFIYMV